MPGLGNCIICGNQLNEYEIDNYGDICDSCNDQFEKRITTKSGGERIT